VSALLISLAEASRRLDIPERTLRDLAVRREFPAQKIGRRWRVSVPALDAWLQRFGSSNVVALRRPA
jgi:excisionase family DNA binding protein